MKYIDMFEKRHRRAAKLIPGLRGLIGYENIAPNFKK